MEASITDVKFDIQLIDVSICTGNKRVAQVLLQFSVQTKYRHFCATSWEMQSVSYLNFCSYVL